MRRFKTEWIRYVCPVVLLMVDGYRALALGRWITGAVASSHVDNAPESRYVRTLDPNGYEISAEPSICILL